mmetsp:Transcript_42397/g.111622  ORF Transcript_42397/g.111622 Transcript_42397/m.111622 type:complete len:307 (-) Transcript_42397:381-1301(-)
MLHHRSVSSTTLVAAAGATGTPTTTWCVGAEGNSEASLLDGVCGATGTATGTALAGRSSGAVAPLMEPPYLASSSSSSCIAARSSSASAASPSPSSSSSSSSSSSRASVSAVSSAHAAVDTNVEPLTPARLQPPPPLAISPSIALASAPRRESSARPGATNEASDKGSASAASSARLRSSGRLVPLMPPPWPPSSRTISAACCISISVASPPQLPLPANASTSLPSRASSDERDAVGTDGGWDGGSQPAGGVARGAGMPRSCRDLASISPSVATGASADRRAWSRFKSASSASAIAEGGGRAPPRA